MSEYSEVGNARRQRFYLLFNEFTDANESAWLSRSSYVVYVYRKYFWYVLKNDTESSLSGKETGKHASLCE